MNTALRKLADSIDALSERIGKAVAWLTLLMVLVTFTIVVLRYAFNMGWIALQESITWMHALVFGLGAAFALKHDAHVRVDIFYARAGTRRQAWVNLIGTVVLLLPVCIFILLTSWDYVAASWSQREASPEAGGLPGIFLLKGVILVMAALLTLQGIAGAARAVLTLRQPED